LATVASPVVSGLLAMGDPIATVRGSIMEMQNLALDAAVTMGKELQAKNAGRIR
jgi:hypothetical protein